MTTYTKDPDAIARLSREEFYVTQQSGTERPGTGKLLANKEPGIYVDIVSGEPLFASADKVIEFGPEKLAESGVGIVWIGREGLFSDYEKNRGADIAGLVAELRKYGIKTILSSILLLEEHTKENIQKDIDDPLLYDLVLNTDEIGHRGAAEVLGKALLVKSAAVG